MIRNDLSVALCSESVMLVSQLSILLSLDLEIVCCRLTDPVVLYPTKKLLVLS